MLFGLSEVDHVEVFVRNIATLVEWCNKVLGLGPIRRWDPPGPTMIGAISSMLVVIEATRDGPCNSHDCTRLAIH